jgi:hypothetical protein
MDGVPIPNTNIVSNIGPQIDPKDINYLEAELFRSLWRPHVWRFQRGSAHGIRAERRRRVLLHLRFFNQTNDQVNFGNHTEKFAYFASINGNRSDYGLSTPGPEVSHDRDWGLGGMPTIFDNPNAGNQLRFVTTPRRDDYGIPNDPDAQGPV